MLHLNQTHNEILGKVAKHCHSLLFKHEDALLYLRERGLSEESIERFCVGYFPGLREVTSVIPKDDLIKVGLSRPFGSSGLAGRITFPIHDYAGNVVAITGRPPLSEEERKARGIARKYWHNSFNKSNYLYGLHLAISSIREKEYAIVTEGQVDVITAFQHGIKNIVCTSSTALSQNHVSLLARYASRIVVVYDNDNAAKKALDSLHQRVKWKHGVIVSSVRLPIKSEEDVDSFLRKCGAQKFLSILEGPGDSTFANDITELLG